MIARRLLLCLFCLAFAGLAQARQIEIIHTNDLHSHFEHSGDDLTRGGYAEVKATIDRLKEQAKAQGIETLTLDAGDFSEGTPFYMADSGIDSWRMVQQMGYDAITIGNHDWLVGPRELENIVEAVQPTVPLLSANLHISSRYKALNHFIRPHVELTRAGVKIAIVGLSTDELVYRWRITDGKISSPLETMKKELGAVRAKNDVVIALTHLGVDADASLISHIEGVDLVVGGHSHTALQEPLWIRNAVGEPIPIVQAGAHGKYVGDLLIDYEPGKPVQVLRYRLVPVFTNGEQDPAMAEEVHQARHELEEKYGAQWMYDVLGFTDSPMETPKDHPTHWGNFYVDAIREAVNAEVGLDDSEFFGGFQPAGPVTREMLMSFYPRVFDLDHPMGWTVWTIHVPGWLLDTVIKYTVQGGGFFNLSNCTYDVIDHKGKLEVKNIRVGGRSVDLDHEYRVAVTEGIGRGSEDMKWILKAFFQPHDSGIPVWTAVEERIRHGSSLLFKDTVAHHLPASHSWSAAPVQRMLLQ